VTRTFFTDAHESVADILDYFTISDKPL